MLRALLLAFVLAYSPTSHSLLDLIKQNVYISLSIKVYSDSFIRICEESLESCLIVAYNYNQYIKRDTRQIRLQNNAIDDCTARKEVHNGRL